MTLLSQLMLHNIHLTFITLASENSRFNAAPEENRLCLLCELDEIDKEVHFLYCCPKISSIYIDFFWLDDYEKL